MSVSIRQLTESDGREMSAIRLRALRSDPSVFGSNYEAESDRTEADWRKWLDPANTAIFMAGNFINTRLLKLYCSLIYVAIDSHHVYIFVGHVKAMHNIFRS